MFLLVPWCFALLNLVFPLHLLCFHRVVWVTETVQSPAKMAGFWWISAGLLITFWVVFFVNDFNGLTPESMKMLVFIGF
jgi:hypothetical protein